jgi:peptidoglycan/LPS O-acetylase OafA/YrhL
MLYRHPLNAWDRRLDSADRNAFDLTRLILAALVVLEHSYFLIENSTEDDPLSMFSRGQMNFGQFAVYMFFAISGFLVTCSLCESPGVGNFIAKRAARIVPGFIVASLVGCLVVGPLAADSVSDYFAAQNWPNIVANILALKQVSAGGAFPNNPVSLVHGTLWTIQYEFDCYLLIALFGALGLFRTSVRPIVFALLAIAVAVAMATGLPAITYGFLSLVISSPDRWADLFAFFFVGSAFFLFREKIPKSIELCAACLAVIVLSFALGAGAYWTLLFCGVYASLYVALSFSGEVVIFGRKVDMSYGVYLYGWPIQQLLLHYSGMSLSPLALFTLAIAVSCPVAWASWTFIERPCLRLVRRRTL